MHTKMSDEMRMKNECKNGKYDGNIHRWKLLDMPRWFGPDAIEVGQGDEDSAETYLPSAYLAARFTCTRCGATTWEEAVFEIEGERINESGDKGRIWA